MPDGREKSWRLAPQRTLRIGREPGNDIVVGDPKVSRRHAEVAFEKGFYILRDLESANGCFVNGRRVRVAPLTEGAEIRIGNTSGRFTEELAHDSGGTVAYDAAKIGGLKAPADTEIEPSGDPLPSAPTVPLAGEPYRDVPTFVPDTGDDVTRIRQSPAAAVPPETKAWSRTSVDFITPGNVTAVVRPDLGGPLWFRRSLNLVGLVASLMALMIALAGGASTWFLVVQGQFVPAIAALLLTLLFAVIILFLIPRRSFRLFEDAAMRDARVEITQVSRFSFPLLRYEVKSGGSRTGELRKNSFTNLTRRKWLILDRDGRWLGEAREHSLARALARKITGHFFAALKTDFVLFSVTGEAGLIDRRRPDGYELTLNDPALPRELVLALVVVLDSVER